jgi:hypothetical protein
VRCFPSPWKMGSVVWPGLHNWAPLGCGPCQTQRPGRMAKHQARLVTHKKKEDWSTMDTVENTYTNIIKHIHTNTKRPIDARTHIHLYTLKKKHVHKNKHDHIITSYCILYVYIYIDIQISIASCVNNYQQLCHYVHDTWRTGLPTSPPCVEKLHHSRSPQWSHGKTVPWPHQYWNISPP